MILAKTCYKMHKKKLLTTIEAIKSVIIIIFKNYQVIIIKL